MAPAVQTNSLIFEDPLPVKSPKHKRVPSVGDVLRGRRRDGSPEKLSRTRHDTPSPLGERHINSPPQSKRIPLKGEDSTRPPMHKKTGSSTSLKGFLMGREKSNDGQNMKSNKIDTSPSKIKSGPNLVGLLKKKSKKDLNEVPAPTPAYLSGNNENYRKLQNTDVALIQDLECRAFSVVEEVPSGSRLPTETESHARKIPLYSPNLEKEDINYNIPPGFDFRPPQRPFLGHKSSRSSIFTENLNDENEPPMLQRQKSRDQSQSRPTTPTRISQQLPKVEQYVSPTNKTGSKPKRTSRILDTIATLNMRAKCNDNTISTEQISAQLSPQELDSAMEQMLGRYDIPENLRNQLRNLKPEVKAGLMKGDRIGSGTSDQSSREGGRTLQRDMDRPSSKDSISKEGKRTRSQSRTRSRILSLSKRSEGSPSKSESSGRARSKSRPKSVDMGPLLGKAASSAVSVNSISITDSAVMPGDFIHYLKEVQRPELVEVGKLHKLRILLRNESVTWTDAFVKKGGMDEIVQLLYRIMKIEWREEHEDNLLHETLLCLKGLSTTKLAMQRLDIVGTDLFPALLRMLFDPERKGPAEYNTRGVVISLIFAHLSATLQSDKDEHIKRAKQILSIMRDTIPSDDKQPLEFVSRMHIARPYRIWAKEVSNVTKEVFWIFLHHMNVVPIADVANSNEIEYTSAYFPSPHAPHPAAPYVGGVEWEATQYLAQHLDLLNGLIVSLPTQEERNALREEFRQSGWEKIMGSSLRTCKEKFYAGVHDGLKVWVAAADKDGWYVEDVRAGPPRTVVSPKKSPSKKRDEEPPKIALDVGSGGMQKDEAWL